MKMTKLTTLFLTATLTLASGSVLAADTGSSGSNGDANAAAEAGQVAPDAKQNIADEVHKNSMCKDGKCPDPNDKVGSDANTKTDGTTQ